MSNQSIFFCFLVRLWCKSSEAMAVGKFFKDMHLNNCKQNYLRQKVEFYLLRNGFLPE